MLPSVDPPLATAEFSLPIPTQATVSYKTPPIHFGTGRLPPTHAGGAGSRFFLLHNHAGPNTNTRSRVEPDALFSCSRALWNVCKQNGGGARGAFRKKKMVCRLLNA